MYGAHTLPTPTATEHSSAYVCLAALALCVCTRFRMCAWRTHMCAGSMHVCSSVSVCECACVSVHCRSTPGGGKVCLYVGCTPMSLECLHGVHTRVCVCTAWLLRAPVRGLTGPPGAVIIACLPVPT